MTGSPNVDGAAAPGSASPPPAPNGQDAGKTFTVTDTRSAGDAIAGLLFGAGDDEPPAPGAGDAPPSTGDDAGSETGAEDDQPTGDEGTEGEGEQPPAAIAAPQSWNDEERAEFAKLPPALQQTIARRESQREAALTRSSQEAAETRRQYDAERTAAVALRTEYLSGLQKMMLLAAPEAAALNNIDWVQVQAQSPAEYTRLQAMREQLKGRLGGIEQEYAQRQQELQQYQLGQLGELVQREGAQLNSKWPDFADEVKGEALRRDLGVYLRDSGGFSAAEINSAYDHRLVLLATKAMLYDRQQAARASADAKRNNPAPRVQPPGTTQAGDRGPDQRLKTAVNRLGRTNSVRDAGSLIAELL